MTHRSSLTTEPSNLYFLLLSAVELDSPLKKQKTEGKITDLYQRLRELDRLATDHLTRNEPGDLERAICLWSDALTLSIQAGDQTWKAQIRQNIANGYVRRDNPKDLERVVEICNRELLIPNNSNEHTSELLFTKSRALLLMKTHRTRADLLQIKADLDRAFNLTTEPKQQGQIKATLIHFLLIT